MHDLHITGSAYGIINNQTAGGGGHGGNIIDSDHFELNGTLGVNDTSGVVYYKHNTDYNTAALHAASGASLQIESNIINGTVTFDNGSSGTLISNVLDSTTTINATAGKVLQFNNAGAGAPTIPSYLNGGSPPYFNGVNLTSSQNSGIPSIAFPNVAANTGLASTNGVVVYFDYGGSAVGYVDQYGSFIMNGNFTGGGFISAASYLRSVANYTVSILPTAGQAGRRAYVTDQLTACPLPGAALTGNGHVVCPVFDNGTAWVGD
jgi:hypothetical protein